MDDKAVDRAEIQFQKALSRTLKRVPKWQRESSPGIWYSQYAGFFRNGRKVVYVNAIGAKAGVGGWRERAVSVCDDGLQSFGAVLDLDHDVVDSFEFNGTLHGKIRLSGAVDLAKPEWQEWFDDAAATLPKIKSKQVASPEWTVFQTTDGLSFRAAPSFGKRNDHGCWEKNQKMWPGTGWRDICVGPGRDPIFWLKPEAPVPGISDQHTSTGWRAATTTFGIRRAIVERALVSGGIEGAHNQRRTNIAVELDGGGWAVVWGQTGDDDGYGEILAIAGTIQVARKTTK